jgi:hypothetical protein
MSYLVSDHCSAHCDRKASAPSVSEVIFAESIAVNASSPARFTMPGP